ncbi:MAG TPA: hypothetical protein V6D02_17060, partial [Candidatus Obscuribacterales bacterium]
DDGTSEPAAPPLDSAVDSHEAEDEWAGTELDWEDEFLEPSPAEVKATTTQEALAWVQPLWRRGRGAGRRLLAGIRRRIPAIASWSDGLLSVVVVGILGLLLVLLNQARSPAAAIAPPPTPKADTVETGISPSPAPLPATPTIPSVPTEAIAAEGDRIAQIQQALTDSAIYNAQRVIDSVQADLVNNHLTLVCNGDWYRLSTYDQSELARQLLSKSQALAFESVQLRSVTGDLLARSPVIGTEMVILQREPPPAVPVPERPRYRLTIDR